MIRKRVSYGGAVVHILATLPLRIWLTSAVVNLSTPTLVLGAPGMLTDQVLLQVYKSQRPAPHSMAMLQIQSALHQTTNPVQTSKTQDVGDRLIKHPLKTIVINLDSRRDRWLSMVSQLAPLNAGGTLQVQRLQAAATVDAASDGMDVAMLNSITADNLTVDAADSFDVIRGADLYGADVTKSWSTNRNAMYVPFNFFYSGNKLRLSSGERNCAMSHIQAWHEVGQSAANMSVRGAPTLILEDDAVLSLDFVPRLQGFLAQEAVVSDADLMYLGYEVAAPLKREVAPGVFEAEYLWTTIAYLLWPSGARKLLEALPVDQPVDNYMATLVKAGRIKALAVSPKLVHAENSWDVNSDIAHSDEETSFWLYRLGRVLSLPLNFAQRVSQALGDAFGLRSNNGVKP